MEHRCYTGYIESAWDAHLLVRAAHLGLLPLLEGRPKNTHECPTSGAIYIYDEHRAKILRWTDGRSWGLHRTPGTGRGRTLLPPPGEPGHAPESLPPGLPAWMEGVSSEPGSLFPHLHYTRYHELDCRPIRQVMRLGTGTGQPDLDSPSPSPPALHRSPSPSPSLGGRRAGRHGLFVEPPRPRTGGLLKQVYVVTRPDLGSRLHLVAYHLPADVGAGLLQTPSRDPQFAALRATELRALGPRPPSPPPPNPVVYRGRDWSLTEGAHLPYSLPPRPSHSWPGRGDGAEGKPSPSPPVPTAVPLAQAITGVWSSRTRFSNAPVVFPLPPSLPSSPTETAPPYPVLPTPQPSRQQASSPAWSHRP